jgi:hypothetical protein
VIGVDSHCPEVDPEVDVEGTDVLLLPSALIVAEASRLVPSLFQSLIR